ncbi:MAG: phospholipase D-like domain-containing protein [Nocardioidaceae bacterium]
MRFSTSPTDGFRLFAVTGVNTVSFAVDATAEARAGLLGFALERVDPVEDERYVMPGFKVFQSVIPNPGPNIMVSTWDQPIQSLVWDDFTAKPDREYDYLFYPMRGEPKNLDRADPIPIRVRTEPLFSDQAHDVFFNRGVASSQAYTRRFGNRTPDEMSEAERAAALEWLTRDLDEAIVQFIRQAGPDDCLLGCFYEFHYPPVLDEFKAALDRGVDVQLIVDAKVNGGTNEDGSVTPNVPRDENLAAIEAAGIPASAVIRREARPNDIAHNKFLVLLRGESREPAEVWTGSTNVSLGAFAGQTNVGHWVRDAELAALFAGYWAVLSLDPGAAAGDDYATTRSKNAALRRAVDAITGPPESPADIPAGVTPIFSPRADLGALALYSQVLDGAVSMGCVTLAFGINKLLKQVLADNGPDDHIVYLLLERADSGDPKLTSQNNVYEAWGSYVRDPLYQWARETSTRALGLNVHVIYVHSKFMLADPLSDDPVVVTGSANFSEDSTTSNDENMILIRGNLRVADIYFTEFNRLFNHYYFRSILETVGDNDGGASLFLAEDDSWLAKYALGTLRSKRVEAYVNMAGVQRPPSA